jgi:uncharacterized lipoprotein
VGETSGVGDASDVGRGRRVRRGRVATAVAVVLTAAALMGTSACSLRGQVVERPPARTGAEVDPGIEWHVPSDAVPPPTMTTPDSDGRVATQEGEDVPPLRGVDA